jgi:upstream activation factor subunit UAF30
MSNVKNEKGSKARSYGRGSWETAHWPDAELARIVGSAPITRSEMIKRIWDYIRTHNLQDPRDKRTIRADANLKQVFNGKDKVSMFEMTKLVNQHLSSTLPGDPIVDPDPDPDQAQ